MSEWWTPTLCTAHPETWAARLHVSKTGTKNPSASNQAPAWLSLRAVGDAVGGARTGAAAHDCPLAIVGLQLRQQRLDHLGPYPLQGLLLLDGHRRGRGWHGEGVQPGQHDGQLCGTQVNLGHRPSVRRARAVRRRVQRVTVISLMLSVPDAGVASEWYQRALGATELWNIGSVIGLEVDGAPVFLSEPQNDKTDSPVVLGSTTVRVEVFVEDPDAFVDRAAAAGANYHDPVRDHDALWGKHRQGGFFDPFGHLWLVGDKSPLRRHG